jgi:hypothetical protein
MTLPIMLVPICRKAHRQPYSLQNNRFPSGQWKRLIQKQARTSKFSLLIPLIVYQYFYTESTLRTSLAQRTIGPSAAQSQARLYVYNLQMPPLYIIIMARSSPRLCLGRTILGWATSTSIMIGKIDGVESISSMVLKTFDVCICIRDEICRRRHR